MPYYRFTPISSSLSHPDWELSMYHGSCAVVAKNPDEAINYVTQKYLIAAKSQKNALTRINPWDNEELVKQSEIAHVSGALPPEGEVIVPQN